MAWQYHGYDLPSQLAIASQISYAWYCHAIRGRIAVLSFASTPRWRFGLISKRRCRVHASSRIRLASCVVSC